MQEQILICRQLLAGHVIDSNANEKKRIKCFETKINSISFS